MSYQVFARKYRPKTFEDVLGQDHVVQTLRNAIVQKRLAHAYLFVGPRGTGKTSIARIFAKALNCTNGPRADFDPNEPVCVEISEGRSLDVLEVDGATNNGVEQVRDLCDSVKFAPSSGQYRIFYIDEVHMLTSSAFNALLKTLEEPPAHVIFIFATTEPTKILPTILSRCQRFDLRPIPTETIAEQLQFVAKQEGIDLAKAAGFAIAKGADGGMRDAQSMLDQVVSFCGNQISEADVLNVFGFTSREKVAALTSALLAQQTPVALSLVQNEAETGRELSQLLNELIGCLRALLVVKLNPNAGGEGMPVELWQALVAASKDYPAERIIAVIEVFADTEARMKWASNKRLYFEIGVIKAIQKLSEVRLTDIIKVLTRGADFVENPPTPVAQKPIENQPLASAVAPDEIPVSQEKSPAVTPVVAQKSNGGFSSLDSLIEAAPEVSAPVEIDTPPWKPAPSPVEAQPAAPVEKAAQPTANDAFYNDPLIQAALVKFEGKFLKA